MPKPSSLFPEDENYAAFLNGLKSRIRSAQRIIALQDESPLRETLLDPKYPFTDWDGVNPQYKGFDACIEGMESLGDAIDERFDLATQAVEAGNPIPDFDAHFWAVDEMEVLVDEARDLDGGLSTDRVSKWLTSPKIHCVLELASIKMTSTTQRTSLLMRTFPLR